MTNNGHEHLVAGIPRTATGAPDHAALAARARELRREAAGAFVESLVQGVVCAWAKAANRWTARPLPGECLQG